MTKKNRDLEDKVLDKVVPHIGGCEGYPARYQPSYEMMRQYSEQ